LEFSPAVFERLGWKVPLRITRAITIPLVITGIVLSTMHQSSLGTLMTIFPDKIHPLWYSLFNPIFFYISAIAAGIAMIVMETHFSAQAFRYKFEGPILARLVKAIPWILGLYLVGKLADLIISGDARFVFAGGWPTALFLTEMLVGVVAPIYLFSKSSVRHNRYKMFWSATLVVLGLMVNRFNLSLVFLDGAPYLPSWTEILVTFGLISIGIIIYDLAFRTLPVLHPAHHE
jgi:Ni/Fe-hydrogenase subunit HybB-like protein